MNRVKRSIENNPGYREGELVYGSSNKFSTDKDFIYLDVNITAPIFKTTQTLATINFEYNEAILDDPSDYYCAVSSFSIPGGNIPIFYPYIQEYPNTNINLTIYSVTLAYDTFSSDQTFLLYIPNDPDQSYTVVPPTARHPLVNHTPYYYIYEYNDFLKMVNITLENAFIVLQSLVAAAYAPAPSPIANALAPYFIINLDTLKLSLIVQTAFYDSNLVDHINIFMNNPLFVFFEGMSARFFGFNQPNGLDELFLIYNSYNNFYNPPYLAPSIPPLYYIIEQQGSNVATWYTAQYIVLTSNTLPLQREYIPPPGITGTLLQSVANGRGVLGIYNLFQLTDIQNLFLIAFQEDGPYRTINLNSNVALTKMDIQVYWVDKLGVARLVDIPTNETVGIRLVFINKDVVFMNK